LARRSLLRGSGALLALPLFEAMLDGHGEALADGTALPKRLAVWFFGNGVILPKWVPSSVGATWQSEELAPLLDPARGIDVKSYVNVVSGYNVKTPNLRGHHNGVAAMLSGAPFIPLPHNGAGYSSKFSIKSIDQVAADAIGAGNTIKSLQIAVSKRYTTGEGPTLRYLSHRGPDEPLPQVTNPATLFNTLFGSFTPKDPTDPRDRLRASVLDAVRDDAKRLQAKLGTQDKQRLEAHLTGISEVRTRILALPPKLTSSCSKPGAPTQTNQDVGGVEPMEAVSNVMSDLLALAFACDLTRVATFQFSGSVGGHCYKDLSPNTPRDNEHAITHDDQQQDKVHAATVFTVRCLAYTLSKLQKSIEGAGNVLDNSAVLVTSDVAEGLSHGIDNYPILVAGKAGGALRYPGIHHRGTGQNTSQVLLSLMKAVVGPQVSSAGAAEGLATTACTQILT
jgi:hypothetical protein